MNDVRILSVTEVQHFLDNVGQGEFTVIFLKADGSQRKITGFLDTTTGSKKSSVAVMTDEGWKRFNTDSVLMIERV